MLSHQGVNFFTGGTFIDLTRGQRLLGCCDSSRQRLALEALNDLVCSCVKALIEARRQFATFQGVEVGASLFCVSIAGKAVIEFGLSTR